MDQTQQNPSITLTNSEASSKIGNSQKLGKVLKLLILLALIDFIYYFLSSLKEFVDNFPFVPLMIYATFLSSCIGAASLLGIWSRKKWAVYTTIAIAVISVIIQLIGGYLALGFGGATTLEALLTFLVFAAIVIPYFILWIWAIRHEWSKFV